jgi:hypothetical protein
MSDDALPGRAIQYERPRNPTPQVVIPRMGSHRAGPARAEQKNFNGDSTTHTVPLQEKNPLTREFLLFKLVLVQSSDRLLGACYLKVIELTV